MRYEVSFKCAADIYQYDKELEVGDFVAVQSGKGYNVGVVSRIVPSDTIVTFRENKTQQILNKLTDDRSTIEEMLRAKITFENDALARCRHYCSTHRIGNFIRVIAAEFQFDRKKLTIFVMKAGDASVCKLVRKLFDSFKIRISILDIESPELARHYAIKYIQLSGINLPLNSVYLDPSIIPYVPPTQQLGKSKSSSLQQSLSQFSESMNSQRKYAEYESTPQVHPSVSSSSSLSSSSSSSSLNYSQGMIGYSPSTTIHTPYDRNELRFNERGYIPEYSSNYGSNSSGIGIGITGNYRNTVSSFPIPPSSTSTSNYQKGSYPPLSGHSISSSTPISAPVTTSTTTSLVNEIEEDYYIKDMSRYYSNDINQYLSSQLNQTHLDEADYDEDLPYEQYTTTTTTTTIPTSTGLKEQHLLQHHHVLFQQQQVQQQQQQPQQSFHYYRGNEKYSRNSSHYDPEEDLYLRERYIRDTDYPTTSSNTPTTATNTTSNTSLSSSSTSSTTINTMGTALNNPSEYHQRDIERYISKVDREYHHHQQQQPSFHHGQQNYSRQSQHQPVYDDGYHRNVTVENYEHYYKTKTTPSTATTPATIIPSSSLPSTIFSEIYEQNFYKQQQQQSLSSSSTTTTRGPNINLNRVPNQYSIASTPNVNSYNNNTNTNITTHSNNNNNINNINNNSPTTNINNTTNTMINNNNSNNNSNNINNNNNTYITLNSNNVNNSSTERDYVNFSNESVSLISTSFGAVNVPPDNLFTSSISRASILESNNNNTSNNINNINNTNKNILTYNNNNNNINSNNNSNNPLNPSTNNPINSNLSMNSNDYHSTTLPTQVDSNYNNSNNNNNNMISSTSSMSS